jgi:hypothetical protein
MSCPKSLRRATIVLATVASFGLSAASASATPMAPASPPAANAPGGSATHVDEHRPAGAGTGRKIG